MLFKSTKGKIFDFMAIGALFFLVACNSNDESNIINQHLQAHQLKIVGIKIEADNKIGPDNELALRTSQTLQFQAYGILADGSRLQSKPDSRGETTAQTITDLVIWSSNQKKLANISSLGLLTASENAGSVTVKATFTGQEATESVIISDAALDEISIDTTNLSIDACRDLELTATGVLKDGNIVTLDGSSLVWTAKNTDPNKKVGKFKDNKVASLSTYLEGSVKITAQEGTLISSQVSINVTGGLEAVILSNTAENKVDVGKTIEITAKGVYSDKKITDITANTVFTSGDVDIATFTKNVLKAKKLDQDDVVEISGSCNNTSADLSIKVNKPAN